MTEDKNCTVFCNRCQGNTNHKVVYKFNNDDGEDIYDPYGNHVDWVGMYQWHELLQCLGCKQVSLLSSEQFSQIDHDSSPLKKRHPAEKHFIEPNWVEDLPSQIVSVLTEVYTALQYDCLTLACSGLRTVLDSVFVEKIGDFGTFHDKVDKMIQGGFLAGRQRETILAVIDAGNASAHRGFVPDAQLLARALRITESLLESTYIHPDDEKLIKESTPKRVKEKEVV